MISHITGIAGTIADIFRASWWIVIPAGLFFTFYDFWMWGKNTLWKMNLKWVLLEIKIPKNILKTPKAMENVLSVIHSVFTSEPDWEEKFLKGQSLKWLSLEIVGHDGEVHFYIRVLEGNRNLAESAIYSEYPDAEITEAEDYIQSLPKILPNKISDVWGTDFILTKENPYPIKTYEFFESPVEEQRLDPISSLTEAMSRLKSDESIWLQYLIKPVSSARWKEEGEKIRDKMMQRKEEKNKGFFEGAAEEMYHFSRNLVKGPIEYPDWPEKKEKEEKFKLNYLSPGETNILKGVEKKISKLGFETIIRFVYIDKRDSFTMSNVSAVTGIFRQFNTQDMNGFKLDKKTRTFISPLKLNPSHWNRKKRAEYRKRQIYDLYRERWFSWGDANKEKHCVLNTEELATLFHFPITTAEAPLLRRLETRRGEPPRGLPITE